MKRWQRLLGVVITSVVLAGLFVIAPSIVTPEQASQAAAHDRWGYTNGCSVPLNPPWRDAPGGFNFHDACDSHDLCYVFHSAGEGEAGRKACDDMFYRLMQQSVYRYPWYTWYAGLVRAGAYYTAVRACGGQPFVDANPRSRANVPGTQPTLCGLRFYIV